MAVHAGDWIVPPNHMKALEDYTSTRSGDWFVVNAVPHLMKYCLHQQTELGGKKVSEFMNVELDIEPLLDFNQEQANGSNHARWGQGLGTKIASIPSGLLFNDNALHGLGRALREGDKRKSSRILNDPEFRKLRTFHGNV
jgi:hypothetical protein